MGGCGGPRTKRCGFGVWRRGRAWPSLRATPPRLRAWRWSMVTDAIHADASAPRGERERACPSCTGDRAGAWSQVAPSPSRVSRTSSITRCHQPSARAPRAARAGTHRCRGASPVRAPVRAIGGTGAHRLRSRPATTQTKLVSTKAAVLGSASRSQRRRSALSTPTAKITTARSATQGRRSDSNT